MHAPEENWTVTQLEAAVAAYALMSERLSKGESVTKAHIYAGLAEQYGRTPTAYKRRFYNISHVLVSMGLPHIPGIGSQAHVGAAAEAVIRQAILHTPWFMDTGSAPPAVSASLAAASVPAGSAHPTTYQATVTRVNRDPDVVDWVLDAAAGHCENCGLPAPFLDAHGEPFLEVHHVKWLAKGGSDQVTNAVALCPNCHREFHHGASAAQLAVDILGKVSRLVAE